jgi:hypothetical protein
MFEKKYQPLSIPKDSAWQRKTWRTYAPHWLLNFIDGIKNIIKWIPIIYKDKNWDHRYIYDIIEFKLLQQRNYLIKANRHTNVWEINRDITICLNLIQLIKNESYSDEFFDYYNKEYWFEPTDETNKYYTYHTKTLWENYDGYISKYPLQVKKLLNSNPELSLNKHRLCREVGRENENKAKRLLFKILNEKLNHWWD